MKEVGIIQKVDGKRAKVSIQRHAACGDCGACQVGQEKMTMETTALNPINAVVGDRVEVEMPFKNVLSAAMIAYGIPLVMFLVGSAIGFYWLGSITGSSQHPVHAFLTGIAFTLATYLLINKSEKMGRFSKSFEPKIVDKCS
ncbi:MAG TPA: sigma E factor regulator [Eubacteriaceae bacterium]|nr:sigma E factor regulator [Eubacteriaceae bacterium]